MSWRNLTRRSSSAASLAAALLIVATPLAGHPVLQAEEAPARTASREPAFDGGVPTTLNELRAMQQQVQRLCEQVLPMTVAVQVGSAQGSGVIIDPDGFVLTAAHVSGKPGQTAWLMLHDGRRVRGETLGVYRTLDAGLIKIKDRPRAGKWPVASMGDSSKVAPGQWCLAAGHPGGIQDTRPAVIRLGRILSLHGSSTIKTDCTLIGGDSGGPLFDMEGKVIGINSRIGNPLNVNLHVPVNTFRSSWQRLAQGDAWGHTPGREPFIGVQGKPDATDATLSRVFAGTPAAAAGLQPGDVVVRFAGRVVSDFSSLQTHVSEQEPGQRVRVVVRRDGEMIALDLVIGERDD
jgi:serine protease Do